MRIKLTSPIALFAICLLLSTGCQRELKYELRPPPQGGTGIWKTAGVTGQILDADGMPVNGAEVKFGTRTVQTDKNGYFSFANTTFTTAEAFVTVKKSGFFSGSRTFYPREGSNNYVKIQLIRYFVTATIDATMGGIVELRNGMLIELPADGIVTASGANYTGEVNVAAAYLDPTSADINEKMPGDLRGLNTTGQQRILKSLGMVAVELTSATGLPVNLKTGEKAILTFPIPASLAGSAPASVPLWYFDDAAGLWKEEGVAINQGSEYVGEVSHFTFWNVDVPCEFIRLSVKVTSPDGTPLGGAKVTITSLASGVSAYDFTDNTGYVEGGVPKGEALKMEVFDNCNNVVLTRNIGPYNTDTDLGSTAVTGNVPLQTIYGTVNACNGTSLASGTLQVILSNNQSEFAVIDNGQFSITYLSCAGATSAQLIAIDDNGQQQGNVVTVQLPSNNVNAGALQACGVAINTFLNITIDGVPQVWNNTNAELLVAFEDTTYIYPNGDHDLVIIAGDTSNGKEPNGIYLQHPPGTLTAPAQLLMTDGFWTISASDFNDYTPMDPSMRANVTTYGPIGQFVAGNFNGMFTTFNNTTGTYDTVSANGSFRVKRTASWWW
ncbi:MAG: carboxypeptidase regulatory-like domain-containing protein [Chitinophagaceae bacterium]|nr:carboxypeptidase regulatory-like domain-containing protein [Chitinophagaceae bacterium]